MNLAVSAIVVDINDKKIDLNSEKTVSLLSNFYNKNLSQEFVELLINNNNRFIENYFYFQ